MITKEYKEQLNEKQKARELHALSQQHSMGGVAFKDFFDKTPFLLNDIAEGSGEVKQNPKFRGNKFTKPKKKRK